MYGFIFCLLGACVCVCVSSIFLFFIIITVIVDLYPHIFNRSFAANVAIKSADGQTEQNMDASRVLQFVPPILYV